MIAPHDGLNVLVPLLVGDSMLINYHTELLVFYARTHHVGLESFAPVVIFEVWVDL